MATKTRTDSIKTEAHRIVDSLPDGATWEDLMERLCVREAVEQGYRESEKGLGRSVEDVRESFGLDP